MNEAKPSRPPMRRLLARVALQLLPLAGALFLDWSIFAIVCLYWIETLLLLVCSAVGRVYARKPFDGEFAMIAGTVLAFSAGQYIFLLVVGVCMDETSGDIMTSPFTSEPSILINAAVLFVTALHSTIGTIRRGEYVSESARALLPRLIVQTGAILAAFGVGITWGSQFFVAIVVLVALRILFEVVGVTRNYS